MSEQKEYPASKKIKEIVLSDLQESEYLLNNDGAWNNPTGRETILKGLEEMQAALQYCINEVNLLIADVKDKS